MSNTDKITSTCARSDDGNVQITFTIPFAIVEKAKSEVLGDLNKEIDVPGFRRGKAPLDKVEERVSQESLIERILGRILPKAVGEATEEHKVKPALYPKFELIKAKANEDWQIRTITCELPRVELGDYENIIRKETVGKSKEENEQKILKILLTSTKFDVPKLLIEQETNSRLSNLLERIEKLGLTLEGYLASTGKTTKAVREEYEAQAENSIRLELILLKIADEAKIKVSQKEVDSAISVAENLNTPEQRRIVESVLRKRAALTGLEKLLKKL